MSDKNKSEEDFSTPSVTLSQADYDALLARLKELEGMKEQLQLAAADFDNAKKRLAREREDFMKFGQESLIRDLLPVIDNFERALAHAGKDHHGHVKNLVTGIQMVLKQLQEILKSRGLRRLETVGKMFDPHLHEAVAHVEERGKEDEIVEEVEPGYRLHDRLLRAAKVKVRVSSSKAHKEEEKQEEIT